VVPIRVFFPPVIARFGDREPMGLCLMDYRVASHRELIFAHWRGFEAVNVFGSLEFRTIKVKVLEIPVGAIFNASLWFLNET
jgi:hypothetical protein